MRELERRLGLAALDARDADKAEQDRILPPGRTVAEVLDESQVIMGEVVDMVNGELRMLEGRIIALEQGLGVGGVCGTGGEDPVAAEMDTTDG